MPIVVVVGVLVVLFGMIVPQRMLRIREAILGWPAVRPLAAVHLRILALARIFVSPFVRGKWHQGISTLSSQANIPATISTSRKGSIYISCVGRNEGGYSIVVPSEMLMVRKHSEHPAELAQLAGTRLVVCSELEDGQRFAEARIKMLTGRDSVNARFMRRDPFTFTPTWTLWLIGNQKPDATTGGPAFWRRLKFLPFDHVMPEEQRDPNLPDKLLEEAPAILAWIARGAALYHQQGLATPQVVNTATEAYRQDQDTVERFVGEHCHRATSDLVKVPITHFRDAYEGWCKQNGDTPASPKKLTQDLRDKFGVGDSRTGSQRFYTHICLLTGEEE